MPSPARTNFKFAMLDVTRLLELHDAGTGGTPGRPSGTLEVFKRAGVILAVTAWETFIEETLTAQLTERLARASRPQDIAGTFKAVAAAWLARKREEGVVQPADLSNWAQDGWKKMVTERFLEQILALNTPNSSNIRALSKRYLTTDVTKHWSWQATSAAAACRKLDQLVKLRGDLVHQARSFNEIAQVRRHHLEGAVNLVQRLAVATELGLGIPQ